MHKMTKKKNEKKNSFISYEFNNPFEFSTELALERSDISETWPKSTVREINKIKKEEPPDSCLLYTSPSPRDSRRSRMPSSA